VRFSDKHQREFARQRCRDARLHRIVERGGMVIPFRHPEDQSGLVGGVMARCGGPCGEQVAAFIVVSERERREIPDLDELLRLRTDKARTRVVEAFRYRPAITSRPERPLGYLVGAERWLAMTDQRREFHEMVAIVEEPYASAEANGRKKK
jgi:hypothetical protein